MKGVYSLQDWLYCGPGGSQYSKVTGRIITVS